MSCHVVFTKSEKPIAYTKIREEFKVWGALSMKKFFLNLIHAAPTRVGKKYSKSIRLIYQNLVLTNPHNFSMVLLFNKTVLRDTHSQKQDV